MIYDFDWSSLPGALPYLWQGMSITLEITLTAIVTGMVGGTLLAMMRLSRVAILSWFAVGYVNLLRSIPLVMVLLWFFLIVPGWLTTLFSFAPTTDTRFASALIGFSLFESAYYAEIMRAGIQSIPQGQAAAAYALGMSHGQTMRLIILPQALRNMTPLLLTQAIILFQDISLVYVIGLADFFGAAYKIGERDGRIIELMLFAAAVYFTICYAASMLVRCLQKKINP